MPSFAKCIVFLTLSVAANALTTPLMLRGMRHRSIAAHAVAAPMEEIPTQITEPVISVPEGSGAGKALRRRKSNNGRCSQKSSSSALSSTPSATLLNPPSAEATGNSAKVKVATSTTATSTSKKSKATSTSTHTSSAATPSVKSGSKLPSFMSGLQTGQATYYGTGLGSCGITSSDTDKIVAVSELLYDTYPGYTGANPNNNPVCGKQIKATYQGKSVTVKVVDRCTACKITDLDLSPSAFSDIADQALGRLSGMTWEWV